MSRRVLTIILFLIGCSTLLYELLLTRLFSVVMFNDMAHLALGVATLGTGLGALVVYLRPGFIPQELPGAALSRLCLLLAACWIGAVLVTLHMPLYDTSSEVSWYARNPQRYDLLFPGRYALLLLTLMAPTALAGAILAAVFRQYRHQIGSLYGAELLGAGIGTAMFLPILSVWSGPDTVFWPAGMTALAAVVAAYTTRSRAWRIGSAVTLVGTAGLVIASTQAHVLQVRHAAGWDESKITHEIWTPTCRLTLIQGVRLHDQTSDLILLDNTSASTVVHNEKQLDLLSAQASRSLIYRMHPPEHTVAVLAASAGPEVAVAQRFGFTRIDAIDIAGGVFELMREQYPNNPLNPYLAPGVRTLTLDARAALNQTDKTYDIIHMVHANFHGLGGMMARAWSPRLITTREAFASAFDRLSPQGSLLYSSGSAPEWIDSAAAALRDRGIADPAAHMRLIKHLDYSLLITRQPITPAVEEQWAPLFQEYTHLKVRRVHVSEPHAGKVLSDDHPYPDTPASSWKKFWSPPRPQGKLPDTQRLMIRTLMAQGGLLGLAGLLFIGLPWWARGRSQTASVRGAGWALAYVACLGYGFLAIETVALHQLVLYIGHPTYALTVVVLALLTSSGLGSLWSGRYTPTPTRLRALLCAVLGLGAIQALFTPTLLELVTVSSSIGLRMTLAGLALCPLGWAMGTAFPMGMGLLGKHAEPVIPWAWALNAWTSTFAALGSVVLARNFGFTWALIAALVAYGLAAALVGRLSTVRGAPSKGNEPAPCSP